MALKNSPKDSSAEKNVSLTRGLIGLFTGAGILHFVKPEPFDSLVPQKLPGSARAWTLGSGVAELGTAALLASPKTRAIGGLATAALMAAVWPGNMNMTYQWRNRPWYWQLISYGRLPLQLPLIMAGLKIWKGQSK